MAALIALMIVVGALAFCLWPVLSTSPGPPGQPRPLEALEAERGRLVAAIRDADLDLAMGKISAADHADMRSSLEIDALAVLARLEQVRPAQAAQAAPPAPAAQADPPAQAAPPAQAKAAADPREPGA